MKFNESHIYKYIIFYYRIRNIDFLDIIYPKCYKILKLTNDFSDKQTNWKKKIMLEDKVQNKLGELLHLTIKGINVFLTLPLHNIRVN